LRGSTERNRTQTIAYDGQRNPGRATKDEEIALAASRSDVIAGIRQE